jgi:hypothetical protein
MQRLLCDLLAVAVLMCAVGQATADYLFTALPDVPGGHAQFPFGINNSGEIVGSYYDSSSIQQPFLLSGGTHLHNAHATTGHRSRHQ